jgi:hypothetical protein
MIIRLLFIILFCWGDNRKKGIQMELLKKGERRKGRVKRGGEG